MGSSDFAGSLQCPNFRGRFLKGVVVPDERLTFLTEHVSESKSCAVITEKSRRKGRKGGIWKAKWQLHQTSTSCRRRSRRRLGWVPHEILIDNITQRNSGIFRGR